MLDKTVPYHDIIMCRKAGLPVPKFDLPKGYTFTRYTPGDEEAWAGIESSVGEFPSPEKALNYLRKHYLVYPKEVKRRTIFIQKAEEKLATFTIWWDYIDELRVPSVHWVAVKPDYQGLGLGKAIICQGMEMSLAIEGSRDIYLHTQTWSYRAIAIYLKAGFRLVPKGAFDGSRNSYGKALPILRQKLKPEIFSMYCEP